VSLSLECPGCQKMITVSLGDRHQAECPHCRAVLDFDSPSMSEELGDGGLDVPLSEYDPSAPLVQRRWVWTRRGLRSMYASALACAFSGLSLFVVSWVGGADDVSWVADADGTTSSVATIWRRVFGALAIVGVLGWVFGSAACAAVPSATGAKIPALAAAVSFGFAVSFLCALPIATAIERWASTLALVSLIVGSVTFASFLVNVGAFLRDASTRAAASRLRAFVVLTSLWVFATKLVLSGVDSEMLARSLSWIEVALAIVGLAGSLRVLAQVDGLILRTGGRPWSVRLEQRETIAVRV
jgi:hypothetical protein